MSSRGFDEGSESADFSVISHMTGIFFSDKTHCKILHYVQDDRLRGCSLSVNSPELNLFAFSAHVLERIDSDFASGLDVLHDKYHDALRYSYTASRIGVGDIKAMEEERVALLFDTFRVIAHIQHILIGACVIGDPFAVLGIEIGDVLDIDQLVEVLALTRVARPIIVLIHLDIFHLTAGIVSHAESLTIVKVPTGV